MLVVTTWKGKTAAALRLALRMTCDEFSAHLGVSSRGVAKWESHSEGELALRTQQLLDTALKLAADDAKMRFTLIETEQAATANKILAAPAIELPPTRAIRVTPDLVRSLGQGLQHHYTADNLVGPRALLPAITAQADTIESLSRAANGQLLTEILGVGAGYAEFAGWLAQDSGDASAATSWYRRALEWAEAAGDDRMAAFVLTRRAVQAIGARQGAHAAQLAHAAQRSVHPSTTRVRALAAQTEAVGHAVGGSAADADRSLDLAERLLSEDAAAEAITGDPSVGRYCDLRLYLDITKAKCHLELGRGDAAVEAFTTVIDALPPEYHRDRGQYLARLAHAYVLAGAPAEACTTAEEALAIAVTTGSSRTIRDLRRLANTLGPWSATDQVVKLQGLLAGTK